MEEKAKIDLESRNGQRALSEYYGKVDDPIVPGLVGEKNGFDLPFLLGTLGEKEVNSVHVVGLSAPGTWSDESRKELTVTVNGLFDEMFM